MLKQNGTLRLIFDTRLAVGEFAPPPYTALASGLALARVEMGEDASLYCEQGDVQCCFYQFLLPEWIQEFFGLPEIEARYRPADMQRALGVTGATMVSLLLRVVPMGWSWAVYFIQAAM